MRTRCKKAAARMDKVLAAALEGDLIDSATALQDLLTDLRHYAEREEIDWDWALRMSYGHYLTEKDLDRRNKPENDVGELPRFTTEDTTSG